jgi:uncharacterized protein YidB (DUF937 family)
MNFVDDMKNKVMGNIAEENPTASAALELLKNHPGGISGLVQQFHDKGLGDVVNSWVSTGQNLPISADQIKSVLSNEHIQAWVLKKSVIGMSFRLTAAEFFVLTSATRQLA